MSDVRYFGYVCVHYPAERGELVLRTEADWHADVFPDNVSLDGERFDFLIEHDRPYLLCKPLLKDEIDHEHWASGTNKLVVLSDSPQPLYPHFFTGEQGRITSVQRIPSATLGRDVLVRLYLPAGYDENLLKHFPVIYMHDGKNLFFPEESFLGQDWQVDERLNLLNSMSLIDRTIVVGVHAGNREQEYTQAGYEAYGSALVNEIKPWVDANCRTLPGPRDTSVMGASLGGVVSFFLAWQWPEVFSNASCLSSTFGFNDDLLERVRSEGRAGREELQFYLDSGWPNDNYEVTLTMAQALLEQGFVRGRDMTHLVFPHAAHGEASWAARVHIPLQLFSSKTRRNTVRQTRRCTSRLEALCPED